MNNPYAINYLGKTYNTTIHKDLTDEEYEEVVREYYAKPDFKDVQKQIKKLAAGGVRMNYITNYYFKDLMAKTKLYYNNGTIEEALKHKPLVEFFAGKAANNKKVFPDNKTLCQNIETAFRLCGFKTASKPSQFPIKPIDSLLEQYNVNNRYYDFSAGGGTRMISSMRHSVEYYATDPNYILCERLNTLKEDGNRTLNKNCFTDIRSIGSEIFIPEGENKIGLAFSSPPYFCLEDYQIGEQSYKPGTTYDSWKEKYLEPTIKNIYKYLIDDGYFAININNFKNYFDGDLVEDTYDLAIKNGFELCNIMPMTNITRCSGHAAGGKDKICGHDNDEKIMVFKKSK